MLYDYLTIYKPADKIKDTDLILLISDITQSCLDPFDQSDILAYLKDYDNIKSILNSRNKHHKTFMNRLDYFSPKIDRMLCTIKPRFEINKKNDFKHKNRNNNFNQTFFNSSNNKNLNKNRNKKRNK